MAWIKVYGGQGSLAFELTTTVQFPLSVKDRRFFYGLIFLHFFHL